jgi:hypothetical protein
MLTKKQWVDAGYTVLPNGAWVAIHADDGLIFDEVANTLGIDTENVDSIVLGITAYEIEESDCEDEDEEENPK